MATALACLSIDNIILFCFYNLLANRYSALSVICVYELKLLYCFLIFQGDFQLCSLLLNHCFSIPCQSRTIMLIQSKHLKPFISLCDLIIFLFFFIIVRRRQLLSFVYQRTLFPLWPRTFSSACTTLFNQLVSQVLYKVSKL